MKITVCTCGVMTGGKRDPSKGCPVHRDDLDA